MDRYDRLIRHIQGRTEQEIIQWKVDNIQNYSDVILNTSQVIRAFTANYPVGKNEYKLLFTESKVDLSDEYGYPTQGFGFELFVLDEDGMIVLRLYDGVVDRDDLLKLSGLIDERNDRVKTFFESFDAPGAA